MYLSHCDLGRRVALSTRYFPSLPSQQCLRDQSQNALSQLLIGMCLILNSDSAQSVLNWMSFQLQNLRRQIQYLLLIPQYH